MKNSLSKNSHRIKEVNKLKDCRVCGGTSLLTFLQLGPTPAPNGFLDKMQLNNSEKFYPLDVCFCESCGMVQLAHVVSPKVMFSNYVYIPSTSVTMQGHFNKLSIDAIKRTNAERGNLVVDIGSNDGTLLKFFKESEMQILGVDPAVNLADKANKEEIETICDLFTRDLAKRIRKEKGEAKIITATNVFAHAPDLHDFVEGVKALLSDDGLFIIEFPYLIDLLEKVEFDTIYQEHLSYIALTPLNKLLEKHGMYLIDAKRIPVHGGSIRVYVSKVNKASSQKFKSLIKLEKKKGILNRETYLKFRKRVDNIRHDLVQLLWSLRLKDKKIVGYGASAKGNVTLNYCRIGPETLDYIVDSISYKQGKFTPGMHIQIHPEKKLLEDQPDYTLILAWNFADEIINKQEEYRKKGGKFILMLPEVRIV
ncbi:class I SAM-dependent methyltransferase [Candidatus Daviesbacteria bacterium]|nr:class I SAM-dependent methyltransferase [Candidatus Daviesbacteria bacterium]